MMTDTASRQMIIPDGPDALSARPSMPTSMFTGNMFTDLQQLRQAILVSFTTAWPSGREREGVVRLGSTLDQFRAEAHRRQCNESENLCTCLPLPRFIGRDAPSTACYTILPTGATF